MTTQTFCVRGGAGAGVTGRESIFFSSLCHPGKDRLLSSYEGERPARRPRGRRRSTGASTAGLLAPVAPPLSLLPRRLQLEPALHRRLRQPGGELPAVRPLARRRALPRPLRPPRPRGPALLHVSLPARPLGLALSDRDADPGGAALPPDRLLPPAAAGRPAARRSDPAVHGEGSGLDRRRPLGPLPLLDPAPADHRAGRSRAGPGLRLRHLDLGDFEPGPLAARPRRALPARQPLSAARPPARRRARPAPRGDRVAPHGEPAARPLLLARHRRDRRPALRPAGLAVPGVERRPGAPPAPLQPVLFQYALRRLRRLPPAERYAAPRQSAGAPRARRPPGRQPRPARLLSLPRRPPLAMAGAGAGIAAGAGARGDPRPRRGLDRHPAVPRLLLDLGGRVLLRPRYLTDGLPLLFVFLAGAW